MLITKKLKALCSLLLIGCLLCACNAPAPAPSEPFYIPEELKTPEKTTYETVPVEFGEYAVTSTGKARVTYLETAKLTWQGGTARFAQVHVKTKQYVNEGDVLMTFEVASNTTELISMRLQLERLWSTLDRETASRKAAIEAQKEKAKQLTSYDQRIAELTVDRMQAEYDAYVFQATQNIYDLEAQIAEIERVASITTLVAPFSGVIDSITSLDVGTSISKGTTLVTMHATDNLLFTATDSSQALRFNMPISIISGSGSKIATYTGRVVAAPNILPNGLTQNTVLVKLDTAVSQEELSNSLKYSAQTQIVQNILVVPRSAVDVENGVSFVYVLEDGTAQKKYVVSKNISPSSAWILEGLSQGQSLIVD